MTQRGELCLSTCKDGDSILAPGSACDSCMFSLGLRGRSPPQIQKHVLRQSGISKLPIVSDVCVSVSCECLAFHP